MLTPTTGVTLADYNAAVLARNATHARIVFPLQNVTLTGANISAEGGLKITDLMNPDEDMKFGKAVSQEIVLHLLNSSVFDGFNWGEEFHVDFGVDIGGDTKWVTAGYFKGRKPARLKRTEVIEFTALDRMQMFNEIADDFLDGLTYPITLGDILLQLCSYIGIGIAAGDELADAMSVQYAESPFDRGITNRAVLSYIAEANCCYAVINADGDVQLKWFSDQTGNYSINGSHYFPDALIGEDDVPAVDAIRIGSTDPEESGFVWPISGQTNIYEITNNPLLMNMSVADKETVISAMLTRLSAFGTYKAASIPVCGNWMVETGDIIEVVYDGTETMNMPVFVRQLIWNGGCSDIYECTGKAERDNAGMDAAEEYKTDGKYYKMRSGVDITDEGVAITGDRYLKLRSGGKLDIDSTNFKLNSDEKIIQMENWKLDENGLAVEHDVLSPDRAVFTIVEKPVAFDGNSNPYKELYQSGIYYTYTMTDPSNYRPTVALFGRKKNEKPLILKFSFNSQDNEIWIAGEDKSGGTHPKLICTLPLDADVVNVSKKLSIGTINNSTKRIDFSGTVQFLLIISALSAERSAMFIGYGRTGSCVLVPVYCGSYITTTVGNGYVSIRNSNSNNANIFMEILSGLVADVNY